jgi:hypothetical protein
MCCAEFAGEYNHGGHSRVQCQANCLTSDVVLRGPVLSKKTVFVASVSCSRDAARRQTYHPVCGSRPGLSQGREDGSFRCGPGRRESVPEWAVGVNCPTTDGLRELPVTSRSSNLALAKTFTDRDKDQFKRDSFEYIARFFENSHDELAARNDATQCDFRRIDANRFDASIYKQGQAVSRCTIFLGDRSFAFGIAYSASETVRQQQL